MSLRETVAPTAGFHGTALVGGVRLDPAHGLDFVAGGGRRTSWFRGPDGVVCLGVGPADATHAVLPDRWLLLADTPSVQAVEMPDWTVAASFFEAATVRGLSVSGPASVIRGRTRDGETVVVATRTPTTLRVTVDRPGCRVVAADPSVTVVATGRRVVVDVAGSPGATHRFTLR